MLKLKRHDGRLILCCETCHERINGPKYARGTVEDLWCRGYAKADNWDKSDSVFLCEKCYNEFIKMPIIRSFRQTQEDERVAIEMKREEYEKEWKKREAELQVFMDDLIKRHEGDGKIREDHVCDPSGELAEKISKSRNTCDILKIHSETLNDDPEHLSTDFIKSLMRKDPGCD